MKPWKKAAIAVVVLAIAAAGIAAWQVSRGPSTPAESKYRSEPADRGEITQTVTASGTINPVALINVGSQVSGTVLKLRADFNDRVRKGQVLLELDPTIFLAQVRQSAANVDAQRASLALAQANLQRNERLVGEHFIAPVTLDTSRREYEVAKANVNLAQAQLARSQADFNNSVIRSPIDGVIIKRTIDLGQTVAASFNTPNLFQIANDLTKMQIDTNVSEADIAALREGAPVRFTVDAYPNREFDATVRQFRLAATVVQNVVTYNAVLDVVNQDELLKPGMTAQVRFTVGKRDNVLRVPTAALRFRLSDEEERKAAQAAKQAGTTSEPAPLALAADSNARIFRVYKLADGDRPVPVDVRIGLSNFKHTEITAGQLQPGERIVTRLRNPDKK